MQITFTIPDAKLQRVVDAMKGLYPIPTTTDDFNVTTNDFTDNQWAKESVRRWVVKQVSRYETMVAKNAANVALEDDIIT